MNGWRGAPAEEIIVNYLKGDLVMVVAVGAFGAAYLVGMIAMTVRGLKD